MKPAIALITIATACTLAACRSDAVRQSFSIPAIGSVATRGVGDELVNRMDGVLVPDIEIQRDSVVGEHRIPKGRYDYDDENSKGVWFIGQGEYFYMRKADGQICLGESKVCARVDYILGKQLNPENLNSFQQTLLYNGRIGDRITLGYREFANGTARPAFSNNVDYDLSESKVVGYKGAKLEVINATNTEITYKLLSGFSN